MNCPACGSANPAEFSFCGHCGATLATTCPSCGAGVPPGMRFCGRCGTQVQAAPAAAAAPVATQEAAAPLAERRVVSVLFADLVGFTNASQSRDPEEVRELLARYFEVARKLVELYGGTVEKFIGDAVFAVWGTPIANEDDAERAVRSALDLVQAIQDLGEEVRLPELKARAAVLTGEAAVTLGASGQGMVAGDLVNTASRLQGLAPAGSVLAGDSTRRLTDAAVVYEDFGAHEVKGKDEPVQAWRALRVVAARGGAQRSTALEPPFVGRERELRVLKELFHASVDESRAHLLSVTGIGGIGKSRVAWEFLKYVDGLVGRFAWHSGRCLAYGDGVTYWALAEMVRGRAGILEGEGGEDALAKLRGALETFVPDAEERRWLEIRLAQLIGLAEPGEGDRQDLFAAWRRFFERISEDMPAILVFEDVQWADPSLLEFIDHLLEWSREYRIFIVTLGRAGDSATRGGRGQTALHLEPLARPAMEELITSVAPGLPDALVAQILERAEGVPLYAVETIRMLIDRGLLVPDGATYRVAGEISQLDVPVSLHTLIAARLDGLDPLDRQVVQEASVLGKTFASSALAAVGGRSLADVEASLQNLVRKEILAVRADPRSPERGQYGFLQDVVRQVAYGTLAKRDRREAHLRAAAHLAQSFGEEQDEIVEVLASHLFDAYRELPDADDAPELRQRARSMLTRAGDHAAALGAAQAAQGYYERAAELADSALDRADAEDRAGQMAWRRGQVEAATQLFERAREAFEAAGDARRAALVEGHLGDIVVTTGHIREGADRLRAAYEKIAGGEQDEAVAVLAATLARMYMLLEDSAALPYVETALQIAEDLELREVFSQALNTKGTMLTYSERSEESALLLRHALRIAIDNGHWAAAFRAYNNLGVVLYHTDEFEAGVALFREAADHARRLGDANQAAAMLSSLMGYDFWLGRWDDALAVAAEVQATGGAEAMRLPWLVTRFLAPLEILRHRGEVDEARRWVEELRPWVETDQSDIQIQKAAMFAVVPLAEGRYEEGVELLVPAWRSTKISPNHPAGKTAWAGAIDAALALGDVVTAEELLAPALAMKPGQTPPSLAGMRSRYVARISAGKGIADGVEDSFRAAIAAFTHAGIRFYEAVTRLELAEWLQAQGRGDDAAAELVSARAIFSELRALPWLERVERLTAAAPVA